MQPTCQSINTRMHSSMIVFAMDSTMGIIIRGVVRERGGKTTYPYAIARDLGRRKRHQLRGLGLILQLGNVSNPVYESVMENYLGAIILRVRRGERLRHI